ncbi:MAG: flagellar biosynthesis protein FliQ [Rhodospirillales bacterium]|jgi:flagellar biosynthetic protein FliQ|tara:strand:- start:410 stop:676 length:267 start_codon:yes stop_codon:yes gene_type:complete
MNPTIVVDIGTEALWVILKMSAPIMLAGLGIGLVIALFQALTTIQEMTLTFVPKIIVIFGTIIFMLPYMITTIVDFTTSLFARMASLG